MSDKVKITHEQAEKIKEWHLHTGYLSILLKLHVNNALASSNCLQSLTLDELARALYVGCEVEPQFEVGDWVVHDNRNIAKIIYIDCGIIYIDNDGINTVSMYYSHATESEIAEEKERRLSQKIDKILFGLSSDERFRLRAKLECGDY